MQGVPEILGEALSWRGSDAKRKKDRTQVRRENIFILISTA